MSNELVWMSEATKLIAKVASSNLSIAAKVGSAKAIADRAAVIKKAAEKQGWSIEQRGEISEIEVRAVVLMGELLEPKRGGDRGNQHTGGKVANGNLATMGITKKQSHIAQRVASVPVNEREKFIVENKPKDRLSVTGLARLAKERHRESKRQADRQAVAVAEKPDELKGVFSTVVIDPPWDFGDEGDIDQFGRGKPDYATMSIDQIAAIPVGARAAKDAHVYLWITNRSLPKGFGLLEAWGFRYVTCLTWCKPSIGMGNYFRGSTEQVLFGVRGSLPLKCKNVGTWFSAPRPQKKHSSKPDEFFDLVELCSHGPYLEMFSRSQRDGWVCWGSEAGS